MKDICTYQTAVRLKAAGFPQPAPATGQAWYDESGLLFVVRVFYFGDLLCSRLDSSRNFWIRKGQFYTTKTFAPSVSDLLPALGFDHALLYNEHTKKFVVYEVDSVEFCRELSQNTNAAEALSDSWMRLKL